MNWKEVRPFLQLEHFVPEVLEKRNSAAAGLCAWVTNIVSYFDIVMLVEPKRVALRIANEVLVKSHAKLVVIKTRLNDLQGRFDVLLGQHDVAEKLRADAQELAEKGDMKLELAQRLTGTLGSEADLWTLEIER